jgi:hypothetical protein
VFTLVLPGCLAVFLGLCFLEGRLFGPACNFDAATVAAIQSNPDLFDGFATPLQSGVMAAAALVLTLGFCRLARRSAVGWKWAVAACGACLLAGQLFWFSLEPHKFSFNWGLRFSEWAGVSLPQVQWSGVLIPLVATLAIFLGQRNRESRFAHLPRVADRARRAGPARPGFLRRLWVTPTYWVVTILSAGILWMFVYWWTSPSPSRVEVAKQLAEIGRRADLRKRVWPGERAATLAGLKAAQPAVASAHMTTIDLRPWLNETLNDSTGDPAKYKENNLASLPGRVQAFAGVPFDVAGRVQLLGRGMTGPHEKLFPAAVRGIVIGRQCGRLHLLEGADHVPAPGQKIARLVLHYQDGEQSEIAIVSGEQVQDWWGPVYNTDAGNARYTTSPGTELAWAGGNPAIREREPEFSLRLYRSTFANPHPELKVTSLDYLSTGTDAAPFLVGLTVEPSAP